MDTKTTTSTSLYGDSRDSERGAGGKVRKPSTRKSQATPYTRPLSNQHAGAGAGGWLSKIVDPAYRLVTGGAAKLMPSFFSKTPAPAALPSPSENPDIQDNDYIEVNKEQVHDVPQFGERSGPTEVAANILKSNSRSEELGQNKPKSSDDDSQISKIEQIIKGKTFSRDEINRLMEIISSKATDVQDMEREEQHEIHTVAGRTEGVLQTPLPQTLDEGIQGEKKATIGPATVFSQSRMQEEIGASPIDIARAFMERSRISEHGPSPYSVYSNGETVCQLSDEFASKQIFPSSAPRSSTCWPGAMAQEHHGYTTPYQRGRHGLHDFPRTPYSRTIYSKSRAKLTQAQADSRIHLSLL